MGIEPTSWAWEAQVMAIIRHPLSGRLFTKNSGEGEAIFGELIPLLNNRSTHASG